MPRAKRYFLPGYIWHITSRCINREFLLKFIRDKRRWMYWMYHANLRHNISILNYAVTSNHIHILLTNRGNDNSIPRAMQLVLGCVAQEYNMRKKRKGSFWQDRYHATAIESGVHLLNCMIYIDLNMVRTGVVQHPREYPFCGYQEISGKRKRYKLIDKPKLSQLLGATLLDLRIMYEQGISESLKKEGLKREDRWTSALAIGSQDFVEKFKLEIGLKARSRAIKRDKGLYVLREIPRPYGSKKGIRNRS